MKRLARSCVMILLFAAYANAAPPLDLAPQSFTPPPKPAVKSIAASDEPSALAGLVTLIVRENIPESYEDKRHWGKQDKALDGLHVELDGLKIRTKRKWKQVNHGTWRMARIELLDPPTATEVQVSNIRDAGNGNAAIDLAVVTRAKVFGRQMKWHKGIRVYSLSADATAKVRLTATLELGMKMDVTRFPPDIMLKPQVTAADLELLDFHLEHIGDIGGDVAEELGHSVKRILEDKIADKKARMITRINERIGENEDRLRISLSDFAASKWKGMSGYVEGLE